MPREETLFNIGYSARVERMTACLLGRVNRGASFAQLFLSASVFAQFNADWAIAVPLVALSVYTIVYEPGTKAVQAASQAARYNRLLGEATALNDGDLETRYYEIQEADSPALGAICEAAYVGEYIRLGLPPPKELSRYQKIIAWLAGDLPVCNEKAPRG